MSALCSENLKEFPVVNSVGSLNTSLWRRKFSEFLQTSALWSWVWCRLSLHTLRKEPAWVEDSPSEKTVQGNRSTWLPQGRNSMTSSNVSHSLQAAAQTVHLESKKRHRCPWDWSCLCKQSCLEKMPATRRRSHLLSYDYYVLFHITLCFFVS